MALGRYYWIELSDGDIEAIQASRDSLRGGHDYRERLREVIVRSQVAREQHRARALTHECNATCKGLAHRL